MEDVLVRYIKKDFSGAFFDIFQSVFFSEVIYNSSILSLFHDDTPKFYTYMIGKKITEDKEIHRTEQVSFYKLDLGY